MYYYGSFPLQWLAWLILAAWIFSLPLLIIGACCMAISEKLKERRARKSPLSGILGVSNHQSPEGGLAVSIVARFGGYCRLCKKQYKPGVRIGKWLGQDVHIACRETEVARRREAGAVTALPDARGWVDRPEFTRPKSGRGVPFVPEKRYLDGRDRHGRYNDQSD